MPPGVILRSIGILLHELRTEGEGRASRLSSTMRPGEDARLSTSKTESGSNHAVAVLARKKELSKS